jgi:uncharacterized protein (DUF362 family)
MDLTRRQLLQSAAIGTGLPLALSAQAVSSTPQSPLGAPGLFKGRVAAIEHPGSIDGGQYQAAAVKEMMRRGMRSLTGESDWAAAWKKFVRPGERVGIKVNPVGQPHVISAPEVLREIVDGLESAGIKRADIVVYDRYRDQFLKAGFDKWAPGTKWSAACKDYDDIQLDIEGYDPSHYVDFPVTLAGYDARVDKHRRSYAAKFITQEVDKLINLCVLKDHQSAGVTLALKNLSHGLVNNVCRSHSTKTMNTCGPFIPAVVAMPVIRYKTVLHVLDGIKGLYHGGPGAKPQFVWDHKAMYFATDPVALDHVGWRVIDEKRKEVGKATLALDRPDQFSTFVSRQPEHVEIAGAMGLGEWEWGKIEVRRERLG